MTILTDLQELEANRTTAVFGGTFDPVHNGHLNIARQILAAGEADQVIFVPASIPPHKVGRARSSAEHRVAMLAIALADQPECQISDIELERPGVSYTIETARAFAERFGDNLRLVLGMDSLRDLHLWRQSRELVEEFRFIIYRRPGCTAPDLRDLGAQFGPAGAASLTQAIVAGREENISSTAIRDRLAMGKSVKGLLPTAVLDYITEHRLYCESEIKKEE